jgi:ammonium transporter
VSGWVGSPTICWLMKNVTSAPNPNYSYWVSENVYAMFQLMFAIITPALIIGSIAERMKFKAIFVFMTLWMLIVYFTQGHAVWGINGIMNGVWNASAKIHAMDFAGGTVVHMTSGYSALTLCLILGKRKGFGKENFAPHSLVLTYIGTGMLWVGWYGFNSGSAVAADVIAANAFTTTTIATAVASFVWPMWEWIVKGKPSVLGFCSGAVAGLVVITPACGYVTPQGSIWIGIAAGTICWFMCYKVKGWFGYDDALDTFGVHAIGGTTGAIMTGMLARNSVNPNFATNMSKYVTDTYVPTAGHGTGQGGRDYHHPERGRHGHHRLHHQGTGGSASDGRSRNYRSRRVRTRRTRLPRITAERLTPNRVRFPTAGSESCPPFFVVPGLRTLEFNHPSMPGGERPTRPGPPGRWCYRGRPL